MSEISDQAMERIRALLGELMLIPGLSGHEGRVRRYLREKLVGLGLTVEVDYLGNLVAVIEGRPNTDTVMLFTHMDQLGFVVRKIEPDGFLRVERLGGVPERALASQAVLICVGEGRDRVGIIANKSHHATSPDEKYRVVPYAELYIDAGFEDASAAAAAGVRIGTPVVYRPNLIEMDSTKIAGTAIDDRAGCAVVLEVARSLLAMDVQARPKVCIVFSVQEEFNLRGAMVAAQGRNIPIAIQVDLMLATDTPDMAARGDMRLGGGPGMSLYSFHGRGTLNGTIPHPSLVHHFEDIADANAIPLQRSAQTGVLTDSSYVQLVGPKGTAVIDLGFPLRCSHSSLEICDLRDLERLRQLLVHGIAAIGPGFRLERDDFDG